MSVWEGMEMLNCGLTGYEGALAFPPAVRDVQAPVWVVQWERLSIAWFTVKGEREKNESVKAYLGKGSSCCATTMV
jgi:hypothetical protein